MRTWRVPAGLVGLAIFMTVHAGGLGEQEKIELKEKTAVGDQYRVELAMQLTGQLQIRNGDKTINLQLIASATHRFPERVLGLDDLGDQGRPVRVARHYDEAKATISVQGENSQRTLRPDRRFQVAQRMKDETVTYSPVGPMTREELELTGEHLDVLMLSGLLPAGPVAMGESWTVPNSTAQALTGVDGLVSQDLRCKLQNVDAGQARVSLFGSVTGISRGAEVKISVEGTYLFDCKLSRIVSVEWKQKDERNQGPVTPASKMETTTTVKRTFGTGPFEALLDGVVATVPAEPGPEHLLLTYRDAKGRCEFHHDRGWHVISQNERQAVLRCLERGELIGQLNVTPWTKAKPGEHLTPEELRKHIDDSPGFSVDQVLQSGQVRADDGLWAYRLSVIGTADEVRLMQNYYAVADPQGRQAILTFTTEVPLAEKFAERDLSIVGTVSFPESRPAKP
jgi:hypothetical protein